MLDLLDDIIQIFASFISWRVALIGSILVVALAVYPFTDEETAIRILSEQGYSEIKMDGFQYFVCSADDMFHTRFVAKHPVTSKTIAGTVCSDIFKGATIRFD
jgi:hypothetical protein